MTTVGNESRSKEQEQPRDQRHVLEHVATQDTALNTLFEQKGARETNSARSTCVDLEFDSKAAKVVVDLYSGSIATAHPMIQTRTSRITR